MKKTLMLLSLVIAGSLAASAQVDLTLYNMKSIPQSAYNNPASIPTSKFFIGLPAISSDYFYISNSGFAVSDLITKRPDDSLVVDMNHAISKMDNKNFISNAVSIDLFSFGFRVKKNYISFNITEKVNFNFSYAKDLFVFLQNGNTAFLGKTADFSGMAIDGSHYREYGLNIAREINQKLTVGARIKYLYGMENVSTVQSNFSLFTDETTYDLTLQSGAEINTSSLANTDSGYQNINAMDYLFKQKNTGLGLDLGSHYKLNDHWNFSLSMTDFGYIRWKSNSKNYKSNALTYNFQGIKLEDFVGDGDGIENLVDSLNSSFKFNETNDAYTTHLSTHVFAGINYAFNEKAFAGILVREQFFKDIMIPSATLSLNKQFGRHLTLALSYSALNRTYNNIGFGISTNAGPVQLYVVSDNALGVIKPLDARTLNIHFGFNLLFGRSEKDRDHDKVPDKVDACPDIPGLVSLHGCPDKDGDGIADKDDACPFEAGTVAAKGCPDKDGDGIPDKDDECPDVAGLAIFNGCPDTDGDSIPDSKDDCPTIAGLAQFNGCPDTDGDGVMDTKDQCPTIAGLVQLNGCPDSDSDGVIDQEDNCPQVAGSPANHGCPVVEKIETPKEPAMVQLTVEEQEVINKVFLNLEFETGKGVILQGSYSALDELLNLLKRKPTFKLLIDGHTDNVGGKAFNQKLSEARAEAVKTYLTDKGIVDSRIIAKGYGMTKPVYTNANAEGRQKNRRVEFTIME